MRGERGKLIPRKGSGRCEALSPRKRSVYFKCLLVNASCFPVPKPVLRNMCQLYIKLCLNSPRHQRFAHPTTPRLPAAPPDPSIRNSSAARPGASPRVSQEQLRLRRPGNPGEEREGSARPTRYLTPDSGERRGSQTDLPRWPQTPRISSCYCELAAEFRQATCTRKATATLPSQIRGRISVGGELRVRQQSSIQLRRGQAPTAASAASASPPRLPGRAGGELPRALLAAHTMGSAPSHPFLLLPGELTHVLGNGSPNPHLPASRALLPAPLAPLPAATHTVGQEPTPFSLPPCWALGNNSASFPARFFNSRLFAFFFFFPSLPHPAPSTSQYRGVGTEPKPGSASTQRTSARRPPEHLR